MEFRFQAEAARTTTVTMWDSMLGKGFKTQKCKTLLKLAMARIKLLRNKRDLQVKQMRKEIAQLLTSGQEPSARIRVRVSPSPIPFIPRFKTAVLTEFSASSSQALAYSPSCPG